MFVVASFNSLMEACKPLHSVFRQNQRRVLLGLMVLLATTSASQAAFSAWLASLFYYNAAHEGIQTIFLNWVGLSLVGLFLFILACLGLRGAQLVSISTLLFFFWAIMIFIAPLILGVVGALNFYQYINIVFVHDWHKRYFAKVREIFCQPSTANTLCVGPPVGGININSWCLTNFNSTDCSSIKYNAIDEAEKWAQTISLALASVSIINLCIIALTIFICYRILTAPIITESMNDMINYFLLLPIIGCGSMGWYMNPWAHYVDLPYSWSSKVFIAMSVCQVFAMPLGVLAGKRKDQRMFLVYIVFVLLIFVGLGVVVAYAVFYAGLITTVDAPPS